ncbi:MAG: glycoside hydrolase, partial [Chloroflexi bacterium]
HRIPLLPFPQKLIPTEGHLLLPPDGQIRLNGFESPSLLTATRQLQQTLRQAAGLDWPAVSGRGAGGVGVTFHLDPVGIDHPQGYRLTVSGQGIMLDAPGPAGLFYGVQTLRQLVAFFGRELPCLQIFDWPDFPVRGVMLDISRDRVPTMDTLFWLVDRLAAWKVNQLQLYTEHTFAYPSHPEVWANASPLTPEEVRTLDDYCRARFVELVPNQNTFGHMRRWLIHPRYRPLAECPDGCDTGDPEWGYFDEPFSLCPEDPRSLDLVRSLLDELLPHFTSRQVNVGCDETVELGLGRSREAVASRGKGRVYLDFLLKIYREVKARDRVMQFWADIVMKYPELVPELPRDAVALEWGYEADHPFDDHLARLSAAGLPFYVCPGTSSWNSLAGRFDNARLNLLRAAESGLRYGARGFLVTDWGDNGHWQPLPVSFPGLVYAAGLGWAVQTNREMDIPAAVSRFPLDDPSGPWGQVLAMLGNAYQQPGVPMHNGSVLFWILQKPPAWIEKESGVTPEGLQRTLAYLDETARLLADAPEAEGDTALVRRELQWVVDMLRLACRRGLAILNQTGDAERLAGEAARLKAEFRELWLARSRPGGLEDSLARWSF